MSKKLFFLGCALLTASALGCGNDIPDPLNYSQCPDWVSKEDEGEPMNTEPATTTVDVAACAGGASAADIEKNLAFVEVIKASLGHMVACGRLGHSFTTAVSHYFASLACGVQYDPYPLSYAGTGSYRYGPLTIQTKLLKDTPFGKAGDDIPFDLFDTSNYFDGSTIRAVLRADASWNTSGDFGVHLSGSIEMTPIKPNNDKLALWGIEANDGKPAKLQQEILAKTIGESVGITADVQVEEVVDGVITYRIGMPQFSVDSMYQGEMVPYNVVDVVAKSEDGTQTSSLVDWNIKFIPITAGAAKGSITLRIEGGAFPYHVRYTYPNRVDPDVLVSCTAPAP
jgi:hypothetical protein